jgi:hypothetical protein
MSRTVVAGGEVTAFTESLVSFGPGGAVAEQGILPRARIAAKNRLQAALSERNNGHSIP